WLVLVGIAAATPVTATSDESPGDRSGSPPTASIQDRRGADPIINGETADRDDFPMTGAMLMDATLSMGSWGSSDMRMLVCSSTLIAPDVVLLAAHCLDEESFTYGYGDLEDVEIRWTREADLEEWDGSSTPDWPDDSVLAWDWVFHEDFDLMSMEMGISENHDIALLFLDEALEDLPLAVLPTAEEADQLQEDNEVMIVGWGQQEATSMWEEPPAGTYGIKQQGTSTIANLGDHEFQVGAEESDVRKCHGDSGGPSFMVVDTDSSETMRLVGVTSHAYDSSDCEETGGVDTRVDAYLDWIDQEMRSRCEDGTRAWCEEEGILPPPEAMAELDERSGPFQACACSSAASSTQWAPLALLGLVVFRRRKSTETP
ncbi:MAG: trypsin-like serine protease, partial [Myxococcota bacterium]|nr:trypsin-like serine protease [Myxococcota bacterium]